MFNKVAFQSAWKRGKNSVGFTRGSFVLGDGASYLPASLIIPKYTAVQ